MSMRMGGGGRHLRNAHMDAKPQNSWASFKRVLPWMAPYWHIIAFGLLCLLITTYLGLQPPRIIAYTVDEVIGKQRFDAVRFVVLWAFGIFFALQFFGFLRTYWLHVAGQRLLHTLRTKLYAHYQALSLTFYDNQQTGDLMSRMSSDVEQIENLMVHGMDTIIVGLFGMIITFVYMYRMNHTLALIILIPVPVLAICINLFGKAVRKIYRNIRDRIGDLNARLQDNLSGIRVIKAFSREVIEQEQVTTASELVMVMNIRGIRMWSSFGPTMGFIGQFGMLAVLGFGIPLVLHGELTTGNLTAYLAYVAGFYGPIGGLFQFYDSILRSLAAGERIFEVLDSVPEIRDPETPLALPQVRGEVEFDHVSFKYATGQTVLRDVCVRATPGERIALVGRSGAGKSSFINLIPRFYDVLEGRVLVDGIDVRQVRQADLRRYTALVLQDTFLFNGSVGDNLRYGRLDAGDADLQAAAKTANAHEFIARLPHGYDTEIGERGVKLSGGQKQRLSIARAILADPRILILDEATSSVDSESEFLIHQALDRLMEGRTTFIIAHRLSTIKHADLILVLDNGEIVERGAHAALLRAEGRYAQMYRQQFWLDELFRDEDDEFVEVE